MAAQEDTQILFLQAPQLPLAMDNEPARSYPNAFSTGIQVPMAGTQAAGYDSFDGGSAMLGGQLLNPVLFDPELLDPGLLDPEVMGEEQFNSEGWAQNSYEPGQNMALEDFDMDSWLDKQLDAT